MENLVTMKIELDISAQKILSHMVMHNNTIEKQIAKGLELAIQDITEGDNFVQHIRETTKKEIDTIVHQAVMKWETRARITKMIEEKIGNKLNEYADQLSDKIVSALKPDNNPEP